jgi:diaminohydroxyphosphoribosylaminopyrimidine deaminase/5-amino-6-(5-phosphoribosylamino)uracil reductase
MVGVGTVLADDPYLTCRCEDGIGRDPLRVVVDSRARTPPDAKVLHAGGKACIVAVGEGAPVERVQALASAGAEVWVLPLNADGHVDLIALAAELGAKGVVTVLLEGGPTLLAGALAAGIVDRLLIFYAPKVFGGVGAPSMVAGAGVGDPSEGEGWRVSEVCRVGEDLLVEAWRCSPA